MQRLGIVALAAVGGALAGILLAPKSGKETRQDIADKAANLKSRASDGFEEFKKGADTVKDEVVSGAETIKEEVGRRASVVKDEAAKTTKNISKASR